MHICNPSPSPRPTKVLFMRWMAKAETSWLVRTIPYAPYSPYIVRLNSTKSPRSRVQHNTLNSYSFVHNWFLFIWMNVFSLAEEVTSFYLCSVSFMSSYNSLNVWINIIAPWLHSSAITYVLLILNLLTSCKSYVSAVFSMNVCFTIFHKSYVN